MKTSLIKTLSIDIETYSSNDLSKCGVYKYAESSDFEVLLFAYSVNGGPVEVVDLASGETIPDEIVSSLYDYFFLYQKYFPILLTLDDNHLMDI